MPIVGCRSIAELLVGSGSEFVQNLARASDQIIDGVDQGINRCRGTHLHELCFVFQRVCLMLDVSAELSQLSNPAGIGQSRRFIHLPDVSFGGVFHHLDLVESVEQFFLGWAVQHFDLGLQGRKLRLSLFNVALEPPFHMFGFCIHRIDIGLAAHPVFECAHTFGYSSRRKSDSNPLEVRIPDSSGRHWWQLAFYPHISL